jgi:hypothetical protein
VARRREERRDKDAEAKVKGETEGKAGKTTKEHTGSDLSKTVESRRATITQTERKRSGATRLPALTRPGEEV